MHYLIIEIQQGSLVTSVNWEFIFGKENMSTLCQSSVVVIISEAHKTFAVTKSQTELQNWPIKIGVYCEAQIITELTVIFAEILFSGERGTFLFGQNIPGGSLMHGTTHPRTTQACRSRSKSSYSQKKRQKKNTTFITQKHRVEQFLKGFHALGDYWQHQVDCKNVSKGTKN